MVQARGVPGTSPGGARPPGPATEPGALVKIEDLQKTEFKIEFKTYRLHAANGEPLPLYVRYVGGVWWAIAPARETGIKLPGAQSIIVTAETPREAADALWELLDRIGVCIAYPELAAVP